eukprot:4079025-Amphidinium_carterae.2
MRWLVGRSLSTAVDFPSLRAAWCHHVVLQSPTPHSSSRSSRLMECDPVACRIPPVLGQSSCTYIQMHAEKHTKASMQRRSKPDSLNSMQRQSASSIPFAFVLIPKMTVLRSMCFASSAGAVLATLYFDNAYSAKGSCSHCGAQVKVLTQMQQADTF